MAPTVTFTPTRTPPNSPQVYPQQEHDLGKSLKRLVEAVDKLTVATDRSKSASEAATETSAKNKHISDEVKSRGSRLEIKTVNEVWDDKAYKYAIKEPAEATEVTELEEYIFIVRARIDKTTKERTTFIDVNSEGLSELLREAFKGVNRVNLHSDKPTIEEHLLYNLLPRLETRRTTPSRDTASDETALKHLEYLIQYIKDSHSSITETFQPLLTHGKITFDLLWALFSPNEIVFTECTGTGRPQCLLYNFGETVTQLGQTVFHIEGRYLDFDGRKFGDVLIVLSIPKFHGIRRIDALSVFPLRCHPNVNNITTKLIECGHKFIELIGTHHRHYRGLAFSIIKRKQVKVHVDSRIMIDAACFRDNNPNYFREKVDPGRSDFSNFDEEDENINHDLIQGEGYDPAKLTHEDLIRCSATVPGYGLENKTWLEFAVADIRVIEWQPQIFGQLALPIKQKDMILSLAEARAGDSASVPFDDFIKGKGRGLNILLHGPPGMGKTLTAEVVAEYLHRPLYSVSAGELGVDAAYLEDRLTRIFELTGRWKAVILLDEADTYMEKRLPADIHRNGLVSVFLRNMEYCQSILFLTTNRIREFDDAITSRIHLMIAFPGISVKDRIQIWKTFIGKARTPQGPPRVSEKQLSHLAQIRLNGRQIKNTVTAAHAMASRNKDVVTFTDLQEAIELAAEFLDDFKKMNSMYS